VKSMRGSIDSMRDSLNTLNFAAKEARQVSATILSPPLSSHTLLPFYPILQEVNARITAINSRISSVAATAAQQSQLNALQSVVAKLAADQMARDASVSAAMKDIYSSIRFEMRIDVSWHV
jgi:hypothetical protein